MQQIRFLAKAVTPEDQAAEATEKLVQSSFEQFDTDGRGFITLDIFKRKVKEAASEAELASLLTVVIAP